MAPHFADARCILASGESRKLGYDPMVNNPQDPWKRPMNYPRVWLLLGWLGLDQRDTAWLALAFTTLFLVGVYLMSEDIDDRSAIILVPVLFSPAVMLGLERGNNGLAMFFLLAAASFAVKRSPRSAALFVCTGGVLKLYPFLGIATLLGQDRGKFVRYAAAVLAFALFYVALSHSDIQKIHAATPDTNSTAYGVNVFWSSFQEHFDLPVVARALAFLSYAAVAMVCGCAMVVGRRTFRTHGAVPARHLEAFRIGAAVYLGSFVLLSNWDYRLMFLLLTVPSLVVWSQERGHPIGRIARIALPAILIACWALLIRAIAVDLPLGLVLWFLLNQAAKWVVFGSLFCAFACSLPDWMYAMGVLSNQRGARLKT